MVSDFVEDAVCELHGRGDTDISTDVANALSTKILIDSQIKIRARNHISEHFSIQ